MDNKQYSTRELFRRFAPYFKKYRFTLWMDLFCAALTTVCELVLPLIMRYITNEGLRDLASLSVKTILSLGVLYFGLRIVDCIASYYMSDMGHVMGAKIETDMRRDAYNHLQKLSNTYYNNTKVGQIMGRITNDLFDVTEFAHHCPEEFFIAFLKITVSFTVLCTYSVPLTLIIFLCVPLMVVVSAHLNKKMRSAFRNQRVQIGELNAQIEDSLLGERVVKAFSAEKAEQEKFNIGNKKFESIKKATYKTMALFSAATHLFDGLMYIVVILGGGLFVLYGKITPGALVAYVLYVSTLIATIRRIVEFAEQFQRGMTGIERFFEIMDSPVEITEKPDARALICDRGEIDFKDVSFKYEEDSEEVLEHISLKINAGERLALVGTSGGGKTTLCSLVPRFMDVSGGAVLIDGQDVRDVTLASLRGAIGIVQQDVYLFSGTVSENIAYGKENASAEEIKAAAVLAGADEFISRLPDGYDTYVGERGVKLSGGQKQRLTIARALVGSPEILVLDDSASALDFATDAALRRAIADLDQEMTVLIVSQRANTVRYADQIVVLDDGKAVGIGTHEQLLESCEEYQEIYWSQNERVLAKEEA